ncbi:hypothetical protein MKX01_038240 [Papaver californicum]|nr:hypothetical protein MKX01_038240 [Papaver californicum]
MRGLRSETPKLDEGFYEIEDVRRKRVRKGHIEYLIKWRDWPERSNTWEPIENVQEYAEEFEESLLLRKQKRKRKRKRNQNSTVPGRVDESTTQSTNLLGGSKRRKSGIVRRFQIESTLSELSEAHDHGNGEGPTGDATGDQHKVERLSNYPCSITKIIKPTGYSVSVINGVEDVHVTFVAVSSDGTEVVVDNKQLKADNPRLLCSFYEQNLRYE